jgi:8-amino-7-oxononanoate synthase
VEAALLFNSGYQANLGVITALAGSGDRIVTDALNHASLIDGCRLSRAEIAVYRHGDADHAAELLAEPARRRFLVTESLFSMDGDRAPLADLATIADRYDAALIVDEAHAVGTLGPGGRGLCADAGVEPAVLLATYGKSFGSFGAYAAGSSRLRRWLINRARPFIFTTALPAAVAAASRAALALASGADGDRRHERLAARIADLSSRLEKRGWIARPAESPIVPLLIGDDRRVMDGTTALLERGIYVQGIRPPTVPRGTARLRIGLMADHQPEHVDQLVDSLETVPRGTLPSP